MMIALNMDEGDYDDDDGCILKGWSWEHCTQMMMIIIIMIMIASSTFWLYATLAFLWPTDRQKGQCFLPNYFKLKFNLTRWVQIDDKKSTSLNQTLFQLLESLAAINKSTSISWIFQPARQEVHQLLIVRRKKVCQSVNDATFHWPLETVSSQKLLRF